MIKTFLIVLLDTSCGVMMSPGKTIDMKATVMIILKNEYKNQSKILSSHMNRKTEI